MKKWLKIAGLIFSGLLSMSIIVSLVTRNADKVEPTETPNAVTYGVRYYAVEDGTVVDVDEDMYRKDGKYPTSYAVGNSLYVDDLLGKMTPVSMDGWPAYVGSRVSDKDDPLKEYAFYGWFTDIACTKEFEQGERYVGDIMLYAKVEVFYLIFVSPEI